MAVKKSTAASTAKNKAATKNKTAPRNIIARRREAEAMDLRLKGLSYSKIGTALGITAQAAHAIITRLLDTVETETVENVAQMRRLECERLDTLLATCLPMALAGDLRAVAQVRGIVEDRRKMLGLDAPTKSEIGGIDGQPIGVYAVPMTVPADDWSKLAAEQSAGEEAAATKLLGG